MPFIEFLSHCFTLYDPDFAVCLASFAPRPGVIFLAAVLFAMAVRSEKLHGLALYAAAMIACAVLCGLFPILFALLVIILAIAATVFFSRMDREFKDLHEELRHESLLDRQWPDRYAIDTDENLSACGDPG